MSAKGGSRPGSGRPRKTARNERGLLIKKILDKEETLVNKLIQEAEGGDLRSLRWCLEQVYGFPLNEKEQEHLEEKTKLIVSQRKLTEQNACLAASQRELTEIKIAQEKNKERLLDLIKRKAPPDFYQKLLEYVGADEEESAPTTSAGDLAASRIPPP